MRRTPALAIAAVALPLMLAGCGDGTQSVSAACNALEDAVTDVTDEFSGAMTEAAADPQAASDALDALVKTLDGAIANVTNEEVKAAAGDLRDGIDDLHTILSGAIADPTSVDITALSNTATAVANAGERMDQLCG
jgi:propanediol dehydratase small subunit